MSTHVLVAVLFFVAAASLVAFVVGLEFGELKERERRSGAGEQRRWETARRVTSEGAPKRLGGQRW